MHLQHTQNARRILIIRFSSIGDILLSTPLIDALAEKYPEASIDFLTRNNFAPLLQNHPGIRHVIEFDISGGFAGLRHLKKQLQPYDLVLDIHNNLRSRYLYPVKWMKSAKIKRIHKDKIRRFWLVKAKINRYKNIVPVWQKYLRVAELLLPVYSSAKMSLYLPAEIQQNDMLSTLAHDKIIIAPGAKHFTKRWPAEYFVELIRLLHEKHGRNCVIVGGPEETDLAESIVPAAGNNIVTNLTGKYSLLETAAIIKAGAMVVTNDSGLMHLAACFQKPTLAIFGSTVKELGFFPLNKNARVLENTSLHCRPCSHIGRGKCPKKHFKCMKALLAEDALAIIEANGWI